LAIQVREGPADDDGDNRKGNEHHSVHAGVDEVWKYVVDVKDVGDCTIEDSDACLLDRLVHRVLENGQVHTTLRVPTSSSDGASFWLIISDMKLAAMPMQPRSEMTWSMRTILKVAPSAP